MVDRDSFSLSLPFSLSHGFGEFRKGQKLVLLEIDISGDREDTTREHGNVKRAIWIDHR